MSIPLDEAAIIEAVWPALIENEDFLAALAGNDAFVTALKEKLGL